MRRLVPVIEWVCEFVILWFAATEGPWWLTAALFARVVDKFAYGFDRMEIRKLKQKAGSK